MDTMNGYYERCCALQPEHLRGDELLGTDALLILCQGL